MQKKGIRLFCQGLALSFSLLFGEAALFTASGAPVEPSKTERVVKAESIKATSGSGNSKPSSSSQTKAEPSTKSQSSASKPITWTWDRPYVPAKEVVELEKRANEGDQRAQAEMSLRYRYGDGVPQDLTCALRACESNPNPIAQFVLAGMSVNTQSAPPMFEIG
jgi:hypothetical protein